MSELIKRQKQARLLRMVRKIHRSCGAALFIFFFFISISGLLLGWKKNSGELIMAKTAMGSSTDLSKWQSMDSLYRKACNFLKDSVNSKLSAEIDRIDVRKEKGIVKFIFKNHFTALQLDAQSAMVLQIEQRRSDYIEKIHDGSIIDFYLGSKDVFKLFYTTIMGLALLTFTITGFWLWYGPKRMRKAIRDK
jgi:hypothetical protein